MKGLHEITIPCCDRVGCDQPAEWRTDTEPRFDWCDRHAQEYVRRFAEVNHSIPYYYITGMDDPGLTGPEWGDPA